MSSPAQFVEDAIEAAKRAVQFDSDGQHEAAAYFYKIASRLLFQAAAVSDEVQVEGLKNKAEEYKNRGQVLLEQHAAIQVNTEQDKSRQKLLQFRFLMQQALEADAAGLRDTAIELYTNTIEFVTQHSELMQGETKELTIRALERAEELKGITFSPSSSSAETSPTKRSHAYTVNAVGQALPKLHRGSSAHLQVVGNTDGYTEEEKRVLFHTSKINHLDYVPFMAIDLKEKFQYAIPFTDKDGHLALAPKQRQSFHSWVRPQDICPEPTILLGNHPDFYSIKQTVISDCSFVASLAVSALYEKKFGRKLITAIIYPRNAEKKPLLNPFGKYMIKLHLNGVTRKVIIDDYLPINRHGQLLCSYSANKSEFWISLLEKAYMKVMGGYDFPGSNSNIDLHALTGWIPERVAIRPKDADFNKQSLFNILETRMAKGDVLVTVATGEMSDSEAERTGLVATHAYAVLNVRTVNGVRLLQLKNPWSHLRWRGNYSELDMRHWTRELQTELNYDPHSAAQFDNGVFWIDYDSICAFYDVFYLNWNPELFKYTYCLHAEWKAGMGPTRDVYTIGANPQFELDISNEATGAVWILLTRHIMDIEDFKENREYITVLVYKNNGKRVYYPMDPPPYIDGVRINSPHYLCKIILTPNSCRKFTLVISQYEKTATIYYSLRAYATCPFGLKKIEEPYRYKKEISGEWKGATAGGCGNHQATYRNNPKCKLEISGATESKILVELKGPKQYQVGFDITIKSLEDDSVTAPFRTTSSGSYRSGFVILELDNIPAGCLIITPTTFLPGQEGPFILTVKSSSPIQLSLY